MRLGITLPDGRAAACAGHGITSDEASCVCAETTIFRRFCPCAQDGCHTPHPMLFIAINHPEAMCEVVLTGGWCYVRQDDTYHRWEIEATWGGFDIVIVEPDFPFGNYARCLEGGCSDPECVPPGDTCQCDNGGAGPCANLCLDYTSLPDGSPWYCCKGERDRFGRPTHDWSYYRYFQETVSFTDGCSIGCTELGGAPRSCIRLESITTLTGNEDRDFAYCQVRKEAVTQWVHDQSQGAPFVPACGPTDNPRTDPPFWMDEPGLPQLGSRSTGWVTDYSNTYCECTSYGEHLDSEYATCNYVDRVHQEHVFSCSYWNVGDPPQCCVGCTLDQRLIIHEIITKTPGPDSQGCCPICICGLLGQDPCQPTGGGCPTVPPDPVIPQDQPTEPGPVPPAYPRPFPLRAGQLV